ncbi:MAG: hypothetical protein M3Q89_03815, partial [Verrucomicrobiota bacterium]|nr:hypothetical protein [Verrucomicrobiota bacterium]
AQDAPLPKPESQDPASEAPSVQVSPASSPLPTPAPQLIPPDVLPLSERTASPAPGGSSSLSIPQLDDAFARNPAHTVADATRRQIEWRELRNRIANDADLKAKLRLAEAAPTDLKKRKLLRSYYDAYFGRMTALASTPEMKAYLKDRKTEQLNKLPQPRVRPDTSPSAKPNG